MEHPDNGLIQALFDRELTGAEAEGIRAHLLDCAQCRAVVEATEAATGAATQALHLLDREPDLEAARTRFLERADRGVMSPEQNREGVRTVTGQRNRMATFFGSPLSLPRAASIALLLTGALVTALPGSPVRRWLAQAWEALTESPGTPGGQDVSSGAREPAATGAQDEALPEIGAAIPALSGGIEIWIHDLPDEAELRVLWTEDDEPWIYAGEGTRFSSEDGRLEAWGPPGAVRIEIPRTLRQVIVGLDGAVLLRKRGEEVEILGPVQQRTPSEIRFKTPGSTNDPPA
jgi:hypothetical protein